LKFDEEEELVSALKEQLRLDKELEEMRIMLAACPDFNLMDAFQIIDRHSKGWVTGPEIAEALADFGSFPHREDVYLFVRRYDADSDGRLLYSDFCEAFTPKDTLSS
jgi:Ca2+-binding EF-hand superfamily protein